MPVATFQGAHLRRLLGRDVATKEMAETLPSIGGDLASLEGDAITMEWFPNRPDLLTLEGTARALRAFMGVKPGMPEVKVGKAQAELKVDPSVAKVRPHAGLCLVRGVPFDEAYVQSVIDAQEKLTLGMGRKRKKVAIGIHDAGGLRGPFTYTTVGPDEKPFVPLNETRPMTPAQVLREHPKGQEYAHLVPGPRFPVFLDASGQVLSMPPVINAQRTAVTAKTRDVLIDVTGTDALAVRQTIALLAAGFAERGGSVEAVTVHDASGTWTCPDMKPVERVVHVDDIRALLGVEVSAEDAARALARMGHAAEAYGNKVLVRSPAWRFDLLHEVDWIEDVAVGLGFAAFPDDLPRQATFGAKLPSHRLEDAARRALIGLGWNEAKTLTLSNPAAEWAKWGEAPGEAILLLNPVLEEQTLLRTRLVPSLLGVLAANRHRSLPQRLFEVGIVAAKAPSGFVNRMHVGGVELAARANFSDAKGLVESLGRDLRLALRLEPGGRPGLIRGRQGRIVRGGQDVGWFGELHPDTVLAFGLTAPAVAFEFELPAA